MLRALRLVSLAALGDLIMLVGVMLDIQSISESLWVNVFGTPPELLSLDDLGRAILDSAHAKQAIDILVVGRAFLPRL